MDKLKLGICVAVRSNLVVGGMGLTHSQLQIRFTSDPLSCGAFGTPTS